ncbi:hypothetical protein Leryth_006714 [Lithospermum erythrorhizon]|nr:hypothetical protein Leryth_006714 [Lithospermum erythrorhizon]
MENDLVSWDDIDRCESYLVCCMFDEAAYLASSVIKKLLSDEFVVKNEVEVENMLESAGMVLVQSLKALGRTSEILDELELLYNDVAAIPVHVLHTGACFQISENSSSSVQGVLQDFLRKWRYGMDGYYIRADGGSTDLDKYENRVQLTLTTDKYMEIVELYLTFLGTVKNDMDLAIAWAEGATLPEEKQQELLRRLHSLNSSKVTTPTRASLAGEYSTNSTSSQEENEHNGSPGDFKPKYLAGNDSTRREAILKLSGQKGRCFWWFRTITLRFSSYRFVISNGNMFLACLALIVFYIMRRKQKNLKRFLGKQASSMKRALVDLWKLAFSYQVNPLAAVQPLPTLSQGSR